MSQSLLDRLVAADFESRIVASTPQAMRLLLRRAPEVEHLLRSYDQGATTDDDIRSFVSQLLRDHAAAPVFPHQLALSALSVVLEQRFSSLSEEYLIDLARVRTDRLALASRVARLCLKHRSERASTSHKEFRLSRGDYPATVL